MNKLVLTLVLVLSTGVALAGEVGARNPQSARPATSILEVAFAETGASTRWAVVPFNDKASAHQLADFKSQVDRINQSMNSTLEAAIERKLAEALEF